MLRRSIARSSTATLPFRTHPMDICTPRSAFAYCSLDLPFPALPGRSCSLSAVSASRSIFSQLLSRAPVDFNIPLRRGGHLGFAKACHGERFFSSQEPVVTAAEQTGAGCIHLIVGPMFAGKTTALLKRVQAESSTGRTVAMVKSDKDTRYGLTSIVSHDGLQMPCWAVANLATFRVIIGEEAYTKLDVIGIDEAQFFKDLYSFCQVAADLEGKTIIVAGLDGDFSRKNFGSILDLVPIADTIIKLSSHCELCGKPAHFTFRKIDDRKTEVIGGKDVYMPVCRQHYLSGQVALETARTVLGAHQLVSLQCDTSINKCFRSE